MYYVTCNISSVGTELGIQSTIKQSFCYFSLRMGLIIDSFPCHVRLSIFVPLSVMYGYDIDSLPFQCSAFGPLDCSITTWFNIALWLAKILLLFPWTNSQTTIKEVGGLMNISPCYLCSDQEVSYGKDANTIYSGG